jgi:phosphomannomutase
MLDTDSDRCGFVVPSRTTHTDHENDNGVLSYEPLHRNKLIALLGVIFARSTTYPDGCAIVTDSVTSEGLSTFLTQHLKLQHVRYLKGYANVIGKAKALTESGSVYAPLAIETSGHCAMAENGYLDDGTYTAVKIIACLAQERHHQQQHQSEKDVTSSSNSPLLDLIQDLQEVEEIKELRMQTVDGSLQTMQRIFDVMVHEVTEYMTAVEDWTLDTDNLEGLRIRTGDSQFFMLRKSLHDPIISLQIESRSLDHARTRVVQPLLHILQVTNPSIGQALDPSALVNYLQ